MSAVPEKKDNQIVVHFEEWMLRDLTSLVRESYEEMRLELPWSEKRVHEMLGYATFKPDVFCGLACVDMSDRSMSGAIVASLGGVYYSEALVAGEVFAYVAPAHRDGLVASRLLDAYERWARRVGARRVMLSVSEFFADARVMRGWSEGATQFSKELAP